jgi:alpha-1,2-mannosyltransferase
MRSFVLPRALFVLIGLFAAALGYARLASPVLLAGPMSAQQIESTAIGGDFRLLWAQGHLAATGRGPEVYVAGAIAAQPPVAALGDKIKKQPSFYPPLTLMLLAPLGSLDFATAWWVFSWGSLALLAGALCLVCWRQPELLAFAFGFSGIWLALSFGQATLVLTALYLVLLWGAARHPWPAGAALGLAIFKPHLGILAPLVLLLRRQYLLFLIALFTIAVLAALSLSFLGEATWQAYRAAVLAPMQRLEGFEQIASHHLITVYGALRQIGAPYQFALTGQILCSLAALVCLVVVCRRALSPQLPIAALVLASLLFSPHAYTYDLTLLLIPLLVLVRRAQNDGWSPTELVLVTLLYLAPVLHTLLVAQVYISPVPFIILATLIHLARCACREATHA